MSGNIKRAVAKARATAWWLTPIMLASAAVVVVPGSADAITGCPGGAGNGHCYATGDMGAENPPMNGTPIYLNAISTDLSVNCLNVKNRNTDFANYEMWMDTNDNIYTPGTTWIEEGLKAGIGAHGANMGFQWFWADMRPPGGDIAYYHEHYLGNGTIGGSTSVGFYWFGGGGNWAVDLGPNSVGTSANNGDYAGGGTTGAETTTNKATVAGESKNWQYADTRWNWHPSPTAWDNSNNGNGWLHAGGSNGSPGSLTEVYDNNGCTMPAAQPAQPAAVPVTAASAPAALAAIAARAASVNGDAHPAQVTFVPTTRRKAQALTGGVIPRDNASYLVQLRGHFTGYDASVPPGSKLPTGTVMTLTVDAATGSVTDVSIGNSAANLSALGHASAIG
jgi:hypothetical protein